MVLELRIEYTNLVTDRPLGNPSDTISGLQLTTNPCVRPSGHWYMATMWCWSLFVVLKPNVTRRCLYYSIYLWLFTKSANLVSAAGRRRGPSLPVAAEDFINSIATSCLYDLLWGQWMVPTKPWQSLADNKNSILTNGNGHCEVPRTDIDL